MFHQDLLSTLGMGQESEERPQQAVSHRSRGDTSGSAIEERRKSAERSLSTCFAGLSASVAHLAGRSPGIVCWSWRQG